jgi:hypothetical protein
MSGDDEASMNEELQKWLMERKKEFIQDMEESRVSDKKPSGTCQLCGEKTAKVICLKCGRPVCNSCYFKIIGICKKCVHKDIAERWEGKQPDWEKVLGVEWVD